MYTLMQFCYNLDLYLRLMAYVTPPLFFLCETTSARLSIAHEEGGEKGRSTRFAPLNLVYSLWL